MYPTLIDILEWLVLDIFSVVIFFWNNDFIIVISNI